MSRDCGPEIKGFFREFPSRAESVRRESDVRGDAQDWRGDCRGRTAECRATGAIRGRIVSPHERARCRQPGLLHVLSQCGRLFFGVRARGLRSAQRRVRRDDLFLPEPLRDDRRPDLPTSPEPKSAADRECSDRSLGRVPTTAACMSDRSCARACIGRAGNAAAPDSARVDRTR